MPAVRPPLIHPKTTTPAWLLRLLIVCTVLTWVGIGEGPPRAQAQQTPAQIGEVTHRDAREIISQAEQVTAQFEQLLNAIASSHYFPTEISTLIADSYGAGPNRLFYDEKVIIEDDVNPRRRDSTQVEDRPVTKYLQDFNVTYRKAPEETVVLSGKQFTPLKRGAYYYLNVTYRQHFGGLTQDSSSYAVVRRVATVRAERLEGRWRCLIAGIRFWRASRDSLGGLRENLVALAGDAGGPTLGGAARAGASSDTLVSSVVSAVMQEEARKDYAQARAKREAAYTQEVIKGDTARAHERYEEALEHYTRAIDINPYNYLARARAKETERDFQRFREISQRQLADLEALAVEACKVHDWPQAYQALQELNRKRPDDQVILDKLREVDVIRVTLERLAAEVRQLDPPAAVRLLNTEVSRAQRNNAQIVPSLLVLRAQAHLADRDNRQAKKDIDEAIELHPTHRPALLARANRAVSQNNPHLAIRDYTLMIGATRFNTQLYLERGRIKLLARDTTGALQDIEQAIVLSPDQAPLYAERAAIYHRSRRYAKEIADLNKAAELAPKNSLYIYQRALSHLSQGDLERAGADIRRADELGLTEGQRADLRSRAGSRLEAGQDQLYQGQLTLALRLFTECVMIYPRMAEGFLGRAQAYLALRQYDQAMADCQSARQQQPDLLVTHMVTARVLAAQGQYDPALETLQGLLGPVPNFEPALMDKALIKEKQGLPDEALAILSKHIAGPGGRSAEACRTYAMMLARQGQTSPARRMISRARSNGLPDPDALEAYAYVAAQARDWSDVAKYAERSIKTGQVKQGALLLRAQAHLHEGRTLEAIQDAQRQIELDPYTQRPEGRVILARAYLRQGNHVRAQQVLEPLGKLPSLEQSSEYHATMGDVHMAHQNRHLAQEHYAKALATNPACARALFGSACLRLASGEPDAALDLLEKAFKTGQLTLREVKDDKRLTALQGDKRYKGLVRML